MTGTANVFRQLSDEWADLAYSSAARAAMVRWAAAEPVLDQFDSPARVVAWCHTRSSLSPNAVVAALVRLGEDPLAARTVLQTILPALVNRASRGGWMAGSPAAAWESQEELNVCVVGWAFEQIRAVAGTSLEWPVMTIVDRVWRRVRTAGEAGMRIQERVVSMESVPEFEFPVELTVADRLAAELIRAVRRGRLRRADAGVIYTSRVLGYDPAELAARHHRDVRAVRQQRARAERALSTAGV